LERPAQHLQHLRALLGAAGDRRDHHRRAAGRQPAGQDVLAHGSPAAVCRGTGRRVPDLLQPLRRQVRPDQQPARAGRIGPARLSLRPPAPPPGDRLHSEPPLDRLRRPDLPGADAGDSEGPLRAGLDRRGRQGPPVLLGHGADAASDGHLHRHHQHDRRVADLRRGPALRPVRPWRRGRAVADADHPALRAGLDPLQLREGVRHRRPALPHHRGHRADQLLHHPPDRQRGGQTMSAITPVPGKPLLAETPEPRRQPKGRSYADRPGWVVYGLLGAIILGGMFPLWWSFLIASHDSTILAREPFPLVPGGNFLRNASTVIDTVPFWRATWNSIVVSTVISASVVFFATLAGYAFAKLRFRGRGPLLIFVIATMAVPTQLGVVPLYQVMARLGWTGDLLA